MVVHPERLDWVGNFNWLLQQDLQEFFCYRQHDDTTAPEFFEVLLQAADKEPNAAAVYCDCQYSGGRNDIEIAPSIEGESLDRMLQYIERIIGSAGERSYTEGRYSTSWPREVRRIPCTFRRYLAGWLSSCAGAISGELPNRSITDLITPIVLPVSCYSWPEDRKRAAWTTMFTGLLEAAMPLCRTPEERLFFQQIILDRIVAPSYLYWSKQRAQLLRKAHRRMSRAPEIRGEYTPARRRRTSPNPPRVTTPTGRD